MKGKYLFPIMYPGNLVVGFAGRDLTGTFIIKYLTEFDFGLTKSDVLYGLDIAIPYIKEMGYVIVVEGILDVIRCRTLGFYNVVAPMSTFLSENHIIILKSFTSNFLLAFDGDDGGLAATTKSAEHLDSFRMLYERAEMPDSYDPDSLGLANPVYMQRLLQSQW
jgi:DNA primase